MDRHVIVTELGCKRLSTRAINNNIVAMLGPYIMRYSAITRDLPEAKCPLSTEEASDTGRRKSIDDSDETILSTLKESLFASVRQLSRLPHLPPTNVT
jgi:hypothetical protein